MEDTDSHSLGSLRPPTPLQIDENDVPASSTSRHRVLTPAAAANNLETKRKAYNHSRSRLDRRHKQFHEARQEYHRSHHSAALYPPVRQLYGQLEDLRRELKRSAVEYLASEYPANKVTLRKALEADLTAATDTVKRAYLAVKDDRDYEHRRPSDTLPSADLAVAMSNMMSQVPTTTVPSTSASSSEQQMNGDPSIRTNVTETGSGGPSAPNGISSASVSLPAGAGNNSTAPPAKTTNKRTRSTISRRSGGSSSNNTSSSSSSARLRREEERARLGLERIRKLAKADAEALNLAAERRVALAALRAAVESGAPFGPELAALGPDVPVCLQDYPAVTGAWMSVPVFERVVQELPQVVMLQAAEEPLPIR